MMRYAEDTQEEEEERFYEAYLILQLWMRLQAIEGYNAIKSSGGAT